MTAAARLSVRSPGSAGKALEDQGQDEAAGEGGADRPLGVVGRERGGEAARGRSEACVAGGRVGDGRRRRGVGRRTRSALGARRGRRGAASGAGAARAARQRFRRLTSVGASSGASAAGVSPSGSSGWRLARRLVGHSGGSSPNTRIQIMAATRVDASVASAPNPASMPDHSRRLTKGLSNIVEAFKQTRRRRRVRGRSCRRSSTWRARAPRRRRRRCRRSSR